jgi:hypothetical protein
MFFDEAETAIRTYVEEQWALSAFASIRLVFENETVPDEDTYMVINIEGTFPEAGPYGTKTDTENTHLYVPHGLVFYHCFAPTGRGKLAAASPVRALQNILELQTVADVIKILGANPPSAAEQSDNLLPDKQPGGNYYRVTGSVPFFLIGS